MYERKKLSESEWSHQAKVDRRNLLMRKLTKVEAKILKAKGAKLKSTKNGWYTIG